MVDEAYVEFVRDTEAADGLALLAEHENVVVLRTFSKAYGLAGLRVGYAIAQPAVAESIRKATAPFSVTDLAQAAAVASLDSEAELSARVESIVKEREAMLAALRDQGWDVPEAQGNFVWLGIGDDAMEFAAACDPVSVRPFAGDGVRISVGDPAVNAEFLALPRSGAQTTREKLLVSSRWPSPPPEAVLSLSSCPGGSTPRSTA